MNLHSHSCSLSGPPEELLSPVSACKLICSLFILHLALPLLHHADFSHCRCGLLSISGFSRSLSHPCQSGVCVGSELGLKFPNCDFFGGGDSAWSVTRSPRGQPRFRSALMCTHLRPCNRSTNTFLITLSNWQTPRPPQPPSPSSS